MSWSSPRTYTTGEIITAAILNVHARDNFLYLKGTNQVPTISSGLVIDDTDGDEYLRLPRHTTAETVSVLTATARVVFDDTLNTIKYYNGASIETLLTVGDVDDIAVNGASTAPISSNWAYDFQNVLTSAGDIPYASAGGAWTRLGIGTVGQSLQVASTGLPNWNNVGAVLAHLQSIITVPVSGNATYTCSFPPRAFSSQFSNGQINGTGMATSTLDQFVQWWSASAGTTGTASAALLLAGIVGKLVSISSTGYTINWNATSGVIVSQIMAIG